MDSANIAIYILQTEDGNKLRKQIINKKFFFS